MENVEGKILWWKKTFVDSSSWERIGKMIGK
jgi:hypothetical protein